MWYRFGPDHRGISSKLPRVSWTELMPDFWFYASFLTAGRGHTIPNPIQALSENVLKKCLKCNQKSQLVPVNVVLHGKIIPYPVTNVLNWGDCFILFCKLIAWKPFSKWIFCVHKFCVLFVLFQSYFQALSCSPKKNFPEGKMNDLWKL